MTGNVDWLSTADAAEALGITTRTLYRFINNGDLAAYRFGRVIRVKRVDVDAFIETSRIEPGTLDHLSPDTVPADSQSADGGK
ncbi:MAG: helix-turn-helix domain-containing protein [Acidimicrobiales bacterium]|nr:helix-turn-helix domain-containing protein [Acidimicrobiales bacterium]